MAEKQKIMIVDDDEDISELISLYLVKECFTTVQAYDGEDALRMFEEEAPDLILLDIMLPGIDGYEVLREIRKKDKTPVIMLSAKVEVFDKVLGLELGADDYMIKPFDSKELVARVKAVLRRMFSKEEREEEKASAVPETVLDDKEVHFPGLDVSIRNYTVYYDNERVEMPPKELELLFFLAYHPNQVFSREQLLDHIWGYEFIGDTRTVDVHIKRLREKIKDHGDWKLSTVWGVGYKFESGTK